MDGLSSMENVSQISAMCSYLGHKLLVGDVDAVKFIYGHIWEEDPALIKTISLLQENLTAVEIENDTNGIYCNEFLYYWAMLCIGEQSNLIVKDLGAAEICLKKISKTVPKAKARLAFIELLKSNAPAKNEINVGRINVLLNWAGKQDLFSRIILSRICFYQFLNEGQIGNSELPIRVLRLLELPCQKGHPVAIRFYNEVLACTGISAAMEIWIDETNISADILWDYETSANIQIRL